MTRPSEGERVRTVRSSGMLVMRGHHSLLDLHAQASSPSKAVAGGLGGLGAIRVASMRGSNTTKASRLVRACPPNGVLEAAILAPG